MKHKNKTSLKINGRKVANALMLLYVVLFSLLYIIAGTIYELRSGTTPITRAMGAVFYMLTMIYLPPLLAFGFLGNVIGDDLSYI